jgi:hypothetical protein
MAYRRTQLRRRLRDGRVSPHFRAIEFATKDGSPIPIRALPGIKRHANRFLEPMRARFGPCHVVSGYRHKAYNRSIGGATDSRHDWDRHPDATATDLVFADGTPEQWAAELRRLRAQTGGTGGIGVYPRSGFVHVDSRPYAADWSG